MKRILFIIQATLPKKFTHKEFNITIREHSITSRSEHHLQSMVKKGILKHVGVIWEFCFR